ncbi:MAG TPA: MBL fold metallo-hydrolase [Mesorhizobium sp.]|jgi:glyoxylase-like metal-dependent hydrolase (beta-lactamase superfamily II)|nr:MBL fold metallo-hydrolase [Mesorhizobium sp.]
MQSSEPQTASDWFSRAALGDGVTLFSEPAVHDIFRANMFLVEGGERDMVVDFGMGLASLAAAIGPRKKPVLAVATHAHADHVGSLHEFATRAGPRLEADAFAAMPDEKTYADEFRALEQPVSRPPNPGWRVEDWTLRPAPLTLLLGEGDLIDLGGRAFRVLHLPGHSPGSIGLWDEAKGVLFSGDAIYDGELYDQLPDSDRAAYRRTMERLLRLPVQTVHAGHGDSFDGALMREIARNYLETTA